MTNSFENKPKQEKEAGPNFRIVGGAGEEFKRKAKEQFEGYFGEAHLSNMPSEWRAELEKAELSKTPEELELIAFANQKTNELMEKAGVAPYDAPEKNFHIVPGEFYEKIDRKTGGSSAVALLQFQGIFFNKDEIRGNNVFFGALAFHELAHLKSVFTLEAKERGKNATISKYRAGLTVGASQKISDEGMGHEHFRGLDEAIVASEERKYVKEMLNLPMFEKEREWLGSEEARKIREKIAVARNIPPDEIYWLGENKKSHIEVGYYRQRKVLDYALAEIQKEFPEKYGSAEEVSGEFLRAFFAGSLSATANLVEKTFGKGSFRVLGMMSDDKNSAINTLETLESMRRARESE